MKFSIGIPVYKAIFLKECIDSILSQTYTDFELIIVNDASPEDIDGIVSLYNDTRIRYFKNEKNIGAKNVVDNWNKCLSLAQGKYFVLMGDDDIMCQDYLEEFSNLIYKYPNNDVYHCRTMVVDENSNFIKLTDARPEIESVYDNIWHRIALGRIQFISDFLYDTEALREKGGYYKIPLAWASDDISAYIAMIDKGIVNTNKTVFMYRQNSHSISSKGNVELKICAIQQEYEWINDFLYKYTPKTKDDKCVKRMIESYLKKYIERKIIYTIKVGFNKNIYIRFFDLYRKKKKYNISLKLLFIALLLSIKDKYFANV